MKTRTSIIFIIFLFFININIISAINSVRRTEKKALTLSSVVNGFSFKLLRAITKDTTNRQKNVVVSPLNAAFALGILNDGADGRTRVEIDSILGCENTIFDSISHRLLENFDGVETSYTKKTNMEGFLSGLLLKQNQDSLNKSPKSLHRMSHEYQRVDTLAQVFMNNGIVVNSKYQLKKSYVDKISKTYSATTKIFDFMLPEAKECVNCWYSEKTSNMIPQVVDKITPNDCLYSVNSIYFKGKWSRMFTEENTKYADFEKDNGAKTQIKVINYLDFCLYNKNKTYASLNMKIGDGKYCMIVLLPNKGKRIDDILKTMDDSIWNSNLARMKKEYVFIQIPEFTNINGDIQLQKPFSDMGLSLILKKECLQKMCEDSIHISSVNQKIKIDIDECKGTDEKVRLQNIIGGDGKLYYVKFYATHPFVYAIIENATNTILFIGKYEGEEE